MRAEAVLIKNWVALEKAFVAVQSLPPGYPRMILVHGAPGLGKTTAVDKIHLRHGVYMEASSTWTPGVLLRKLAERLGVSIKSSARNDQILDTILTELDRKQTKIIVIDEFDRVAKKYGLVELVREIYDASDVPIALVGMGEIERTLSEIPQFPQRIGQHVTFQPLDLDDARKVTEKLCEIELTDDLLKVIWKRVGGIIRLLVTELAQLELLAKREGLKKIGVEDLEGR